MNKSKYIISTGWWCNHEDEVDHRDKLFGSDEIRGKDFFGKWYEAVTKFTNPEKIIIVDSKSPVKPVLPLDDLRLEFLSLNENAGHSTNHLGDWCGYTRGVIMGMSFALCCDVDYWVYIEQDALIYGDNIIEKAIAEMSEDFMFGSGDGTPQVLQQSFMIMKRSFIPTFIKNYSRFKSTDNQISPETKFALATVKFSRLIPEFVIRNRSSRTVIGILRILIFKFLKYKINKSGLPFGYGRSRPINFNDKEFYFQHGTQEELISYEEKQLPHSAGESSQNLRFP